MKLKDLLKETVSEISYKNSGLKKPDLADLDKNKEISSWEKKRGGAIEKNMKTEFKTQAPKKEGIRFGNEERPMETMPSLSGGEMRAMANQCEKCGAPMMYEDKMCAECGYMEEDGDATSLPSSLINGPVKDDKDGYSEGMDHEVSMAKASLQNIVSNASQLMNKMGDEEIDIPAWVQDHITNADNYISQANDGYYEYEAGENNETPDQPVYEAKPTGGDAAPKDNSNGLTDKELVATISKITGDDYKDSDGSVNTARAYEDAIDNGYKYDYKKRRFFKQEQPQMEKKGTDKFGYTKNGQAAGPFRGAQGPMQMASGNLEAKKK